MRSGLSMSERLALSLLVSDYERALDGYHASIETWLERYGTLAGDTLDAGYIIPAWDELPTDVAAARKAMVESRRRWAAEYQAIRGVSASAAGAAVRKHLGKLPRR